MIAKRLPSSKRMEKTTSYSVNCWVFFKNR